MVPYYHGATSSEQKGVTTRANAGRFRRLPNINSPPGVPTILNLAERVTISDRKPLRPSSTGFSATDGATFPE
jgi:hypothetical protein